MKKCDGYLSHHWNVSTEYFYPAGGPQPYLLEDMTTPVALKASLRFCTSCVFETELKHNSFNVEMFYETNRVIGLGEPLRKETVNKLFHHACISSISENVTAHFWYKDI